MKSYKMILPLLSASLLGTSVCFANAFDPLKDLPAQAPTKIDTALSQMKKAEFAGKAADCHRLAPGLMSQHKNIQGWVALSWLRCDSKPSIKSLDMIAKSPQLFYSGPWHEGLWNLWLSRSQDLIADLIKKNSPTARARIESVLAFSADLSRDDRAQMYRYLGEIEMQGKNHDRALFYLEQSDALKENIAVQDKIRFLKKSLNIELTETEPTNVPPAEPSFPDEKLEAQVIGLQKSGDQIAALKESIDLLNKFPGGKVARRMKDRPLDIYTAIFNRRGSSADGSVAQALELLNEVDETRLVDWATQLHRRADYLASLSLSRHCLTRFSTSTSATQLLWMAGRSAHFLGQYELALRYYDQLALKHRGSEEAVEAMFRTGLIQYREKNDAVAASLFDKVLAEKKDRYDLNARYWLVRSLQRMKSERFETERNLLVQNFPFSYYGIRLRAEMQQNKVSWPEAVTNPEKKVLGVWLEGSQKDSWKRGLELMKNAWVDEAQIEFQDFPKMRNPALQVKMAERFAKWNMPTIALRWINEAMEQDSNLRKKDILNYAYPQKFKDIYMKEAAKRSVDARLLMSLTRQESAFNARAVSTSNALGLMQLIPPTAKDVAQRLGYKNLNVPEDLFHVDTNIAMGSFYLQQMLKQYNKTVPFALAAYNAGPSRMNLWLGLRPEVKDQLSKASSQPEDEIWFDELPWNETSFYVKAILRNTLLYRLIDEGNYDLSPVVWADLVDKKPNLE